MTRRAPVNDHVGKQIVTRDLRRRTGELLARATTHETLMENLLWILERIDDNPESESIDTLTFQVLGHLSSALSNHELLTMLTDDPAILAKYCRTCGNNLDKLREAKENPQGRTREYCRRACRQKDHRRRLNPPTRLAARAAWLGEILQDTVEQMAKAESKALEQQILRSQVERIARRGRRARTHVPKRSEHSHSWFHTVWYAERSRRPSSTVVRTKPPGRGQG